MKQETEERLRLAAADAMEGNQGSPEFSFRNARGPLPDGGVIGWERYEWSYPKRRCAKCSRKVTSGVVRLGQAGREDEPTFRVICSSCYSEILSLDTPEGWGE